MTPAESSALLRRLATNRDTFTEWVISRAETQAVLEVVAETRRQAFEEAAVIAFTRALTETPRAEPPDPYLHTTLHGVKVKVLLDE